MSIASIWEDKKLPLNGLQIFLSISLKIKAGEVKRHKTRYLSSYVPCKFPLKDFLRANQAEMKCLCDMLEQIILTALLESVTFPRQTLTTTYTEMITCLF